MSAPDTFEVDARVLPLYRAGLEAAYRDVMSMCDDDHSMQPIYNYCERMLKELDSWGKK